MRLQKHADLIDYKMELDSKALKDYCAKGREVISKVLANNQFIRVSLIGCWLGADLIARKE